MDQTIKILGLDPGLRHTGWGLIAVAGARLSYLASGTISADVEAGLAERLAELHGCLVRVLADTRPDEAAVEQTFVNKDASATLKLGCARGVVLLAPAQLGIPVTEYAPNQVKKSLTGAGHCDKAQIRAMLAHLLPLARPETADAADALAIAITHAHHRQTLARQSRIAASIGASR